MSKPTHSNENETNKNETNQVKDNLPVFFFFFLFVFNKTIPYQNIRFCYWMDQNVSKKVENHFFGGESIHFHKKTVNVELRDVTELLCVISGFC